MICGRIFEHVEDITMQVVTNSEADASEFLENLGEMFPRNTGNSGLQNKLTLCKFW